MSEVEDPARKKQYGEYLKSELEAADPADAWRRARATASDVDLICVTGSFFLAAEMCGQIERFPPAPAGSVGAASV